MEDSDLAFDRALHSVGEDGRFHKRYNVLFNFVLAFVSTMVYVNVVLALAEPESWCFVAGRQDLDSNSTNHTSLERWKAMTLPREKDSRGFEVFSRCKMYDKSPFEEATNETRNKTCDSGYEYDRTWYKSTVVTDNDWVCDKAFYGFAILCTIKITEVIGGLITGYLGDVIGRRPIFFAALVCMTLGRLSMPFVSHEYAAFLAAAALCALPSTAIAQSCLVTLMELSPPEDRATIAQIQNFGYSLGMCVLPVVYWILPQWDLYLLVTTAPLFVYYVLSIFLIESPRWLLSRGRVADALKQLKYIAKVNRTRVSNEVSLMLHNSRVNSEKVYGLFSLFSNWRMAKNTLMMVVVWMSSMASYSTLYYAVIGTDGNPFLYAFLQGIIEIPAYCAAGFLCQRYGRRFTCMGGLLLTVLGYAVIIKLVNDFDNVYVRFAIIAVIKFGVCLGLYVVGLQGLEIYPTCIRQTAYSFGTTTGNVFAILSPYIVYLGIEIDVRLPYAFLAALALAAAVAEVFLPETLHERLPDTLHEAKTFGQDQDYWSVPHRKADPSVLADIKIFRRQFSETLEMDPIT